MVFSMFVWALHADVIGLHRAHEDIKCSCLASVLCVDPIQVDRSPHISEKNVLYIMYYNIV